MRKYIIAFAIILGTTSLYAQETGTLNFAGNFVYMPQYKMRGAGYMISYQSIIRGPFYLETGAGYSIASNTIHRDETINDVHFMDLNYHHAGYTFYLAPAIKIAAGSKLSLDVYAGPVFTYQSNVIDQYNYELPASSEYIDRADEVIYSNDVIEGVFPGGIAGCRVNIKLSENWTISGGMNAMGILKAVSSVNTSLGLAYCW